MERFYTKAAGLAAMGLVLLTTVHDARAQAAQHIRYDYNAAGRLTSATFDDAFVVAYRYTPGGGIHTTKTGAAGTVGTEPLPGVPRSFALHANYPNPFNPTTTIRYDLPRAAGVRVAVYDVLGRTVRVLADGEQAAGYHTAVWDGHDAAGRPAASGVYLYRITADDFVQTRAMVLMK